MSKGLVLASFGSSVIANAARASHRRLPRPLLWMSRSLALRFPGELLFGCLLLYYFRVLERQQGSGKYGSYAAVVTGMSYALQLGIGRLVDSSAPLPPAPLPLVFASVLPFLLDIPPASHFTVMGYKMSDKVGLTHPSTTAGSSNNGYPCPTGTRLLACCICMSKRSLSRQRRMITQFQDCRKGGRVECHALLGHMKVPT